MSQDYIEETDFGKATEIPELAKLSEKMQRFVWEWTHNGCDGGKAATAAGYAKTSAFHFLKRQDVIDAITALTDRMLHATTIPAIVALEEVVKDPFHKDRVKAALAILNRTGWPEVQEHRVKVEKVPDEQAMIEAAIGMAKKLGIDPAQLLGSNTPMIELHAVTVPVVDVLPEPLPDGSDI